MGRKGWGAASRSLHAGVGESKEEATNRINLGRLLGGVGWAAAPTPQGLRLGAQTSSQPVEQLREGRWLHQQPVPKSTRLKQSQRTGCALLRGLGTGQVQDSISRT